MYIFIAYISLLPPEREIVQCALVWLFGFHLHLRESPQPQGVIEHLLWVESNIQSAANRVEMWEIRLGGASWEASTCDETNSEIGQVAQQSEAS